MLCANRDEQIAAAAAWSVSFSQISISRDRGKLPLPRQCRGRSHRCLQVPDKNIDEKDVPHEDEERGKVLRTGMGVEGGKKDGEVGYFERRSIPRRTMNGNIHKTYCGESTLLAMRNASRTSSHVSACSSFLYFTMM